MLAINKGVAFDLFSLSSYLKCGDCSEKYKKLLGA